MTKGRKKSAQQWEQEFRDVHGNQYSYDFSTFKNSNTKMRIFCHQQGHGEFWQTPRNHKSYGCRKCGYENSAKKLKLRKKKSITEWEKDFKKRHGDKYTYFFETLSTNKQKMKIKCPIHQEFWQTPDNHRKFGCLKCGYDSVPQCQPKSITEWVKDFKKTHGDKYTYDLSTMGKNSKTKIKIKCQEHGFFWQYPGNHARGYGCAECGYLITANQKKKTKEEWEADFFSVHGDKYIYDWTTLTLSTTKMRIICPHTGHGEFWQVPDAHRSGQGCPHCSCHNLTDEELKQRPKNIYRIICHATNKSYIGCTIDDIQERYKKHWIAARRYKQSPLYNDMRKYGKDRFTLHLLDTCDDIEEMQEGEKIYIRIMNTLHPNGYNQSEGGEHPYSSRGV